MSDARMLQTTWSMFLKAHWDVIAAIDFTTVEVWTKSGLVTCYLLFAMELKTRRVHFVGSTTSPHEQWMQQAARELPNFEDGFLNDKRTLIMDRDTKFCESFRSILKQADVTSVILPPRSPNLNSFLERFFLSLKSECLNRMIFFGDDSLRRAVKEYLSHHHRERNHQGLDNPLIESTEPPVDPPGDIECRERLGGMLKYYHRPAA